MTPARDWQTMTAVADDNAAEAYNSSPGPASTPDEGLAEPYCHLIKATTLDRELPTPILRIETAKSTRSPSYGKRQPL